MKRVVVTADDFGLSPQVNIAVERAHREGVLTATSLMVGSPAADQAVGIARENPRLRVGLHLTLIEATPVLSAARLPALTGPDGAFLADAARLGTRIALSGAARRQVEEEVEAQFEAFARTGLACDHVNAHRHYHLHPVIGPIAVAAARRHGVRAMRVPREPAAVLRRIEGGGRGFVSALVRAFATPLAWRARRAGLAVPDQVFGLAWSGAMTRDRLAGLFAALPEGLTEIYAHPATDGAFTHAAPGYRYADELDALVSPEVREAAARSGAARGGFMDVA